MLLSLNILLFKTSMKAADEVTDPNQRFYKVRYAYVKLFGIVTKHMTFFRGFGGTYKHKKYTGIVVEFFH